MKFPFTSKNKRRKKFQNLSFKNYRYGTIFDPRKNAFLVFEENTPQKMPSFSASDSALKTIDEQMSCWLVFLKTH